MALLYACSTETVSLEWHAELSKEIFQKAKKEDKLVLLSLEANWCHWCHVMEDSTYANTEVKSFLMEHFVLVKADQDAHPELAARYRKFGWPATIVLNAKGEDLWKNAGFMSPVAFIENLEEILQNPVAERTKKASSIFAIGSENAFQDKLKKGLFRSLDLEKGGFNSSQKSVDGETFEYAFFHQSDARLKKWTEKSVQGAYQLCDPEWGGVYQYSTYGDWNHLHFEKLLHIQARYLQIFSWDAAANGNVESAQKAAEIMAYCDEFLLQKNGLYGNAQDADLKKGKKATDYFQLKNAERRKLGIPAVDTNTYTFSNADWGAALVKYYAYQPNPTVLNKIEKLESGIAARKQKNGLFTHRGGKADMFTMRDNLPVLFFYIELSKAFPTNERFKQEVYSLGKAIVSHFQMKNGAFQSFQGNNGLEPLPVLEENIRLLRLLNYVGMQHEDKRLKQATQRLYQFLLKPEQQAELFVEPAILYFMEENGKEIAQAVFAGDKIVQKWALGAYSQAPFYSSFSYSDGKNIPDKDMFATIRGNTGFVCTSNYCSSPLKSEADVDQFYKDVRERN